MDAVAVRFSFATGFGVSVSKEIVDVTGTFSKSTSLTRTFVGVVFFGMGLSNGLMGGDGAVVLSITFGLTVAVGFLTNG